MKLTRLCNSHFAFIAATIFALSCQIRGNYTDPLWFKNGGYLDPINQNESENQSTTEGSRNLTAQDTDWNDESTAISERPTVTFQYSTFAQKPSISSSGFDLTSAVQDPLTTTKTLTTEICEEKNKSLILICFIIIAVLVLLCTFLLLSTVVMANKVSYLKRSKQGKRVPRSNGDFLATSSLWPAGSDTQQKKSKALTGTDLMMQDLILEAAIAAQRKNEAETNEQLTSRSANDQKNQEATLKPCDRALTNFIVEI
ncbi:protein EVI2A [Carettochelys insculpta]|uniref:protein EVI2A n=1 Tax=Carettochelys insculpta TaxID=44489 RepID=UPI003EB6F610